MSKSTAYHHWDRYKMYGVAALRRKRRLGRKPNLSPAQVAELKAVAEMGVDPDATDDLITYPILCRVCEDRFGVVYSRGGMVLLARRRGFTLQLLVDAARRRRNLAQGLPVLPPAAPRRVGPARIATPSSSKVRRDARRQARKEG